MFFQKHLAEDEVVNSQFQQCGDAQASLKFYQNIRGFET